MKKIIFLLSILLYQNVSFSKEMILDKLENPNSTTQSQKWNFITDQVMGGVSSGLFKVEKFDNMKCYRMKGNVSTKNNGGSVSYTHLRAHET